MRSNTPKRFLVRHLDLLRGPHGENWTRYFDSFEQAAASADTVLLGYSEGDAHSVRQELTDVRPVSAGCERGKGRGRVCEPTPPESLQRHPRACRLVLLARFVYQRVPAIGRWQIDLSDSMATPTDLVIANADCRDAERRQKDRKR